MNFSKTIAACDLKGGRCRQPIELMKVYGLFKKKWFEKLKKMSILKLNLNMNSSITF